MDHFDKLVSEWAEEHGATWKMRGTTYVDEVPLCELAGLLRSTTKAHELALQLARVAEVSGGERYPMLESLAERCRPLVDAMRNEDHPAAIYVSRVAHMLDLLDRGAES